MGLVFGLRFHPTQDSFLGEFHGALCKWKNLRKNRAEALLLTHTCARIEGAFDI